MKEERTLVIGSGPSGLVAALTLARAGREVLLLEAKPQLGGSLGTQEHGGFRFDIGLQMLGECGKGQNLGRILEELGLDSSALFAEFTPERHQVMRFGEVEISLCAGRERQVEQLTAQFPAERAGLRRLFSDVERLAKGAPTYYRHLRHRLGLRDAARLFDLPFYHRLEQISLTDYLGQFITEPSARAPFLGLCTLLGMPPARVNAATGLMVYLHFSEGAYYPRGGAAALVDALVSAIRAAGGQVRCAAAVDRILLDHQGVAGVELSTGERLDARSVICAVDPELTIRQLLRETSLPRRIDQQLKASLPGLGAVVLCLGLKGELAEPGLHNRWYFDTPDIDSIFLPMLSGRMPVSAGFLLAPGPLSATGKSGLELVSFAPNPSTTPGAFESFGARVTERMLACLQRGYPGLLRDVELAHLEPELASAPSVSTLNLAPTGPLLTVERRGRRRFPIRTPIPGLYQAGASVLGSGVATCMLSGLVAAETVLREPTGGRRNRRPQSSQGSGEAHKTTADGGLCS